MKGALERIDRQALLLAFGRGKADPDDLDQQRRAFASELAAEEANFTEVGEPQAAGRIRQAWSEYSAAFDRMAAEPDMAARRELYFDRLGPALLEVDQAADEVLGLNQEAMVRKSDHARSQAERAGRLVVAIAALALLSGVLLSGFLTARLLRPLSVLSQSARLIGEGDLEARAQVEGGDEIGELAREFNTMADRLGQYRRSSLGELLQAQQASQAAIDSLPDPVLVLSADGSLLNVNTTAETLLRIAPGGADPFQELDPGVRQALERVRMHVAGGRGPYVPRGFEEAVRFESSEGARYLLPRATPLYAELGSIAGTTVVFQDVTRLMRFDELKNDLVAAVAHEFRTPLTSLRMAIHLCLEGVVGTLTEKQADLLSAARQDCERLQSIVDDLLDLSRIQAGRVELHRRPLSAATLLQDAGAASRSAVAGAKLELVVSSPDPSLSVSADPERMQLVLSNLVANAVRYTPAGGKVELRAVPVEGAIRFEVADSGEGIPRQYQERIFEKFYRVPGSKKGGVGLGLYVSREIVQAHGGEMGVESAPGEGSVFWFTLSTVEEKAEGAGGTGGYSRSRAERSAAWLSVLRAA
jgi:signal transduction histidine kinase/HAMP domain-containing protein